MNPEDKFELVFRNLLERLFVERMDQNEEIFVRFMNDVPFRDIVTRGWRRRRTAGCAPDASHFDAVEGPRLSRFPCLGGVRDLFSPTQEETQTPPSPPRTVTF